MPRQTKHLCFSSQGPRHPSRYFSQRPHAPGASWSLAMEKRPLDPLGRRFSHVGPMGVSQTLTLLPGHLMRHCSGHRARREGHRQLHLVQRACSCLSPLKASAKSSHVPDSALMLSSASLLCPTWPPASVPGPGCLKREMECGFGRDVDSVQFLVASSRPTGVGRPALGP